MLNGSQQEKGGTERVETVSSLSSSTVFKNIGTTGLKRVMLETFDRGSSVISITLSIDQSLFQRRKIFIYFYEVREK